MRLAFLLCLAAACGGRMHTTEVVSDHRQAGLVLESPVLVTMV